MATNGWAGKILRINLTSGAVSTEDSAPYQKAYVGGMGIGYKIIFDEVPMETKALDPESKIVFAVGPLTGSGVPCSGRTNISFLSCWSKGYSILDAHMGGHFAHAMKYAGYDAIIIEGKSDSKKYIKIDDGEVTLEPADDLWGKGTFEANKAIIDACGPDFTSAAIGVAGENLVHYSALITSRANAGGAGIGALFGSKNLKAIAVRGSGSVKIADPVEFKKLCDYMLSDLIGANNNHNVPTYPQSWAEYQANPANRWRGGTGQKWELAPNGPIDTEEQPQGDINRIGYRVMKGIQDFGEISTKYTVKYGGCSSCPIRCYAEYDMKPLADMGLPTQVSNTCLGISASANLWYMEPLKDIVDEKDARLLFGGAGSYPMDDLGLWENYGNLAREFNYCYKNGHIEKNLSKEEFDSIPWDLMHNLDPRWMPEIMSRIASGEGEIATLGRGTFELAKAWNLPMDFYDNYSMQNITYNGYPKHHSSEDGWQTGVLYNAMYNRDCMVHCLTNFVRSGSPFPVIKEVLEGFFGPGCVDAPNNYTPINENKVKLAKWCFINKQWHDMATVCNWMWPMTLSPSKERNYAGDHDLEGKFMTAVTGETWTTEDVYKASERVSNMLRVMTAISFKINENSSNLRKDHDAITGWIFDGDGTDTKAPFTEGTIKLDRADMEKAFDMYYDAMGWDKATGIPTRATLESLDLKDMADALEKYGVLPA